MVGGNKVTEWGRVRLSVAFMMAGLVLPVPAMADGASRPAVALECPEGGGGVTQRLCALLTARLSQEGHALAPDTATRLRLQVRMPASNILFARLLVDADGRQKSSPELELSVMDRDDIPEAALDRFAARLLMIAPF
ncbi:hypothetical protein IQ24_01046 [Paracoccus sulfuroxidans]|uniref:Uncharacterized protein n=2 Tax=Paracoccus sulfuroxidans TaxID=384678 RepID=A0A562NTZ1_9RHOB|nr:hypothetical protein IQ24_01046 [Paracoccus sulfuroxidans]